MRGRRALDALRDRFPEAMAVDDPEVLSTVRARAKPRTVSGLGTLMSSTVSRGAGTVALRVRADFSGTGGDEEEGSEVGRSSIAAPEGVSPRCIRVTPVNSV